MFQRAPVHGPPAALPPQISPVLNGPAPQPEALAHIFVSDGGSHRVAREQGFELTESGYAPRVHQRVEQRQVVAQHVEQMDAARRQARVEARHAQPAGVILGALAVPRRRDSGPSLDLIRFRCRCRSRKANGRQIDHRRFDAGGLAPQGRLMPAGGQIEDLALAAVCGSGDPFQALRHHGKAIFVAGGQRLVEKQRQRPAVLFLRLRPGQPQGEQQLHARAGGKLVQGPLGALPQVAGGERPVAAEVHVEGAGGHLGEYRAGALQDLRLVLRLERLLHVVEQNRRRLGQQRILAPVLQHLPRAVFGGRRLLQPAVPARVVQSGPNLRLLLYQPGMFSRLAGRSVALRLKLRPLAAVGLLDKFGLVLELGARQSFFRRGLVERPFRFLPVRPLLQARFERGAIAGFDPGAGVQLLHFALCAGDLPGE